MYLNAKTNQGMEKEIWNAVASRLMTRWILGNDYPKHHPAADQLRRWESHITLTAASSWWDHAQTAHSYNSYHSVRSRVGRERLVIQYQPHSGLFYTFYFIWSPSYSNYPIHFTGEDWAMLKNLPKETVQNKGPPGSKTKALPTSLVCVTETLHLHISPCMQMSVKTQVLGQVTVKSVALFLSIRSSALLFIHLAHSVSLE